MPLAQFRGVDALQPPVAGVEQERAHMVEVGRIVVAVLDDPGAVRPVAPGVREHVGGEQRLGRLVVDPARRDQADRRLIDDDRAAELADRDRLLAADGGDVEPVERVLPGVGAGAEIEPERGVGIAGEAFLDVEVERERIDVLDRHEFVQPQRQQRERQRARDQRLDLRAQRRLVAAEAGVDQPCGVGLPSR